MKSSSPLAAGCALVFISFLYGVFHAAGPGHGKAVISAWLLATENELRRGVLVAAMSAFFQAMTAIVIVSALLLFVQGAAQMARDVAGVLESVSYLMIAGMGLYLIAGALKSPVPAAAVAAGPFEIVNPLPARHDHVHDEMCGCGHAHVPEAKDVRGDWSLRRAAALAFAVGLRPCSGALLVLIASWGLGLFWAGVVSTLAMGLGVFITISAIAALSVYGKGLALRLAAAKGRGLSRAFFALRLAGGGTILALGGFLFWASLGSQNAFM